MNRVRCQAVLVLSISAALAFSSPAFAQRTAGAINGTVMDSTNAVLPGATVNAVCNDTHLTRTAVTDSQGGFSFPEVPVCVYTVTVELQGFRTVNREAAVTAPASVSSFCSSPFRYISMAISHPPISSPLT